MVTNEEVREYKTKSKRSLIIAQKLQVEQIQNGFKWMIQGTTRKLVNPALVKENLNNGWRLSVSN